MANIGDSYIIQLNYTVNDMTLVEFQPDEIEFYFGSNRYLLSDGTITLNQDTNMYELFVSQSNSFCLKDNVSYQIRIKKGEFVSSPKIDRICIGNSISRLVI